MKNKLCLILSILFVIGFVNAVGLTTTDVSVFNINKSIGQNKQVSFTLTNEETFAFNTINFEENDIIKMDEISTFAAGGSKVINATIYGNIDFVGRIKILGFYVSEMGASNETHNIDVDYLGSGLSKCDFSVIKGDTIKWTNLLTISTGNVKLINADTDQEITTIAPTLTYSEVFDTPLQFKYFFTRFGYQFTKVCTITVLDSQGDINNPEFNAELNLNINVIYKPTTIVLTVLTSNYTITPGQTKQDLLKITNTGIEKARNIFFSGGWFHSFTTNNFDLEPGEERTVGYSITPFVHNTSDTNKTYIKPLTVSGNFDNVEQNFNIFVKYANIEEGEVTTETLREILEGYASIIRAYCNDNPQDKICEETLKKVIIQGGVADSNISIAPRQFLDFMKSLIDFMDRQDSVNNYEKAKDLEQDDKFNLVMNFSNYTMYKVDKLHEKVDSSESSTKFLVMVMTILFLSVALIYFFNGYRNKKQLSSYSQY